MLSPSLTDKILALKRDGRWGWAAVFGRLLLGHLEEHYLDEGVGLIVPNPTWTGAGARSAIDHTEAVLRFAHDADLADRWPIAFNGVLELTGPTTESKGSGLSAKRQAAEERQALLRVNGRAVYGRHVVIYDDVCTTGWQLEACARVLRGAGASKVFAAVLARKAWMP
jgi:predicted amidophosphoribosyltransferase